jgi:DNA repair exonuclease SbcCD ATPase subunit
MASESREDPGLDEDVPAALDDWLDDQAAALGVDRGQLVVQILSSYHAAATLDGKLDAAELLDLDADDFVDVESAVAETVDEQVENRVAAALDGRLDEVDAEFQSKIEDVRDRVIQVKQETDEKAPKAHTHEKLAAVDAIDARVDELASELATIREALSDRVDDVETRLDEEAEATADLTDRVEDATEKLNRVAWVVSDLKEETTGRDDHEQAVDRIRRAAAQEGVSTATCERCGERVEIALLNDPECPHCRAAVSDVRPTGGLFRKKAKLVAAAQLEAGGEPDE